MGASTEARAAGTDGQVDLYADIYTRRVSCLRAYSPQQYFHSPYDLMPHEL